MEEVLSRGYAMRVSIYGDVTEEGLKQLADQTRQEILDLNGINEIRTLGEHTCELSIEVSNANLRRYDLDFHQVANAVRSRSRDLPGGSLRTKYGAIKLILPSHLRHIRVGEPLAGGLRGVIENTQGRFASALKRFASRHYRRLLPLCLQHRCTTLSTCLAVLILCMSLIPSGLCASYFSPMCLQITSW